MALKYYLESQNPIQNISNIPYKLVYYNDSTDVYNIQYFQFNTRSIDWVIVNPLPDSTIGGLRLQDNITLLSGYSYAVVDGGSINVNVYYGSIGSTTKLLSSDLNVAATEVFTTSFNTTTLSVGTWLSIHFGSIDRTVRQITFTLFVTSP